MDYELMSKCVMNLREKYDEYDAEDACKLMLGYLDELAGYEPDNDVVDTVTGWMASSFPIATMKKMREVHGQERFNDFVTLSDE